MNLTPHAKRAYILTPVMIEHFRFSTVFPNASCCTKHELHCMRASVHPESPLPFLLRPLHGMMDLSLFHPKCLSPLREICMATPPRRDPTRLFRSSKSSAQYVVVASSHCQVARVLTDYSQSISRNREVKSGDHHANCMCQPRGLFNSAWHCHHPRPDSPRPTDLRPFPPF